MGADDPEQLVDKPTVEELLADGEWDPDAYRSDTVMVVHIPADRKAAYLVSIPRDSFVEIYDETGEAQGKNKINAAFAAYGPYGTRHTVEHLSGLRIDHIAIIDFAGFRDLTTAIGGVDVYIPEAVYDSKQDQQWEEGEVHLEGVLALKYVRMRYGLTQGDFDRVDRQQNFLRAVMQKTLSDDTIGNPRRFTATVRATQPPHRRRGVGGRRDPQSRPRAARRRRRQGQVHDPAQLGHRHRPCGGVDRGRRGAPGPRFSSTPWSPTLVGVYAATPTTSCPREDEVS